MHEVNMEQAVDTLSAALRFPTIADSDSRIDASVFIVHAMLAARFPLVHEHFKEPSTG